MNREELINTVGGATKVSAAMLNALSRSMSALYDLGRALGTSIKMLVSGKRC